MRVIPTLLLLPSFALFAQVARSLEEAPPPPPPPPPSPSVVADDVDLSSLPLGTVTARVRHGDVVYAVLAGGGVAVVDVHDPSSPKLVTRLVEGRAVSRVIHDGDRLIVLVVEEQAVVFSLRDAAHPVVAVPELAGTVVAGAGVGGGAAPLAVPRPHGVVVDVTGGRVVFDGGAGAGFRAGQRVRVIAQELVDKPDLAAAGTRRAPRGDVTAVVEVEEVGAARAMARLGRGDVAVRGDIVEVTDAPLSERIFLPPRAAITWRTGFHARPFLGLGAQGFPVGALVDGYVHWTPERIPIAVMVEVAPAGFAALSQVVHYPIAVAAGVSYVTDWFEVGLGGGALVGNEGPCNVERPGAARTCEQNTGATFNQLLRLGALDGIHLQWESSIFARSAGFVLGTGRGEFAVPVSSRVGLYGGGGVGENGWGFGEIGVRSMFGGSGGPGTTILSASLGVAGVADGPGVLDEAKIAGDVDVYQQEVVVGPAIGFGMEWRL